jgi:hypothetical protein
VRLQVGFLPNAMHGVFADTALCAPQPPDIPSLHKPDISLYPKEFYFFLDTVAQE